MATATQNRTDKLLNEVLREVREVRFLVEPISRSINTQKNKARKLPKWLQASLKDAKEGRVSGPFDTVDELMAHLQKK
jgi:hypothetical protein